MTSRKQTLWTLQAGRGLAALLVLLYHASFILFPKEKYWGYDPLGGLFAFGDAGVEFFFVLSGFILLYIYDRDFSQTGRVLAYFKKRFLRIYPVYWLVMAIVIPGYFLMPTTGQGYERDWSVILSSLTLVHITDGHTVLSVAWMLYHEVMFYVLFGLLLYNKRWGAAAMGAWFAGSALTLILWPQALPYNEFTRSSVDFFFSPLHLLFAFGMLTYKLLKRDVVKVPWFWALFGAALFLGTGLENDYVRSLSHNAHSMLYGAGSMSMLIGFVTLERQGRLRVPSALRLLGDASYAIYLSHLPALTVLTKLYLKFVGQEALPAVAACLLLAALSMGFGILIHLLAEKPLLAYLKRRLISSSS